jgi:3-keto steroid reductase
VGFNAAIAAVHLAIVSLSFIPTHYFSSDRPQMSDECSTESSPVKFGSQTGRWGDGRVGIMKIKEWKKNEAEGANLLRKCEGLYQSFLKTGVTSDHT